MQYRDSLREFLWADLRWLFVWVGMFAFFGLVTNHLFIGISIGLLIFIIRQWRALYLLHHWVRFQSNEHPPEVTGILAELSQDFYNVHKNEVQLRAQVVSNVQRVRDSISALNECVVLIDANSNIEWWNPISEDILGLREGDKGTSIINLIREPDFINFYHAKNYEEQLTMRSWLDDSKYLKFGITPFGHNDKLMLVDDVTRINSLEQMRKDFIANVSHELRTPLTVFSGYIETFMEQEGLNPAWQRGFAQMQQQTIRMTNIVNDLLMLSRLENTQKPPENDKVNMPDVMMQLFDQAQAYNAEYKHHINLDIDCQTNLTGSKKELMSAFLNLVFNAIKYTPPEGDITISWQMIDGLAEFRVTDNGLGIAPHHISRLTERFYRVDSGRGRDTGGTGLGLAIVKHVLFRHDAELVIHSTENKGSSFVAKFPSSRFCHE